MDPFELLKRDHKKVSQLFKEIEASSGKWKLKRFKPLKEELDLHAHIEETIFYPALEKAKETRAITLEGLEEHKVIKELLAELDAATTLTDEWKAKFTVLKENVEHHVKEEENEMFDKASDVLTGEEADNLGEKMAAEKTKRGSKVDPDLKTKNKTGLIQTIASALGLGGASEPRKKPVAKSGKPAATKAKVATSASRKSVPLTSKSRKSAKVESARPAALKTSKANAKDKAATTKGGRKKTAAKAASKKTTRRR